ncbi:DUF2795 domain-containing protein [Streptomyces sp. NBC_01198]|uniref:DUF2795 domain-containing protein n=1 Tax=Streptomyces sp. NBC_01198 TaxID=2903769 RepID=UPI002E0FDEC1|nr:DUF2795 domain-containing protein [Streptomyces sp. NBC_01198]
MADQGTNKTGFVRDDELKREMQGELQGNRTQRSDDSFDPEPSGEDPPLAELRPADQGGGAPPGMTPLDVSVRSELARHLERGVFPAQRDGLLDALRRNQAPDSVVNLVEDLPTGERYTNVQDVMRAMGLGVEDRRA